MDVNENSLLNIQACFEKNEDLISSILENIHLERLDDCVKQYNVLQANLLNLCVELDNVPPGNIDLYKSIHSFSDSLTKRDVLEDLKPADERSPLIAPLPHACDDCILNQRSDTECRVNLQHVHPSHKLSNSERLELAKASQVIAARYYSQKNGKAKRNYKRWETDDIHTLLLAIHCVRKLDYSKICLAFEDRTETQVRGFITQTFPNKSINDILKIPLPEAPPNFQPSESLIRFLDSYNMTSLLKGLESKVPIDVSSTKSKTSNIIIESTKAQLNKESTNPLPNTLLLSNTDLLGGNEKKTTKSSSNLDKKNMVLPSLPSYIKSIPIVNTNANMSLRNPLTTKSTSDLSYPLPNYAQQPWNAGNVYLPNTNPAYLVNPASYMLPTSDSSHMFGISNPLIQQLGGAIHQRVQIVPQPQPQQPSSQSQDPKKSVNDKPVNISESAETVPKPKSKGRNRSGPYSLSGKTHIEVPRQPEYHSQSYHHPSYYNQPGIYNPYPIPTGMTNAFPHYSYNPTFNPIYSVPSIPYTMGNIWPSIPPPTPSTAVPSSTTSTPTIASSSLPTTHSVSSQLPQPAPQVNPKKSLSVDAEKKKKSDVSSSKKHVESVSVPTVVEKTVVISVDTSKKTEIQESKKATTISPPEIALQVSIPEVNANTSNTNNTSNTSNTDNNNNSNSKPKRKRKATKSNLTLNTSAAIAIEKPIEKAPKARVNRRKNNATITYPSILSPTRNAFLDENIGPMDCSSRLSFDYVHSNFTGHGEDTFNLLESHGDVTLISGLLNENSFM